MTREERRVIFASSLGTVFEWYDFYLYGSLSAVIAAQFFSGVNPTAAFIFALLAFAAGFAVRPFGALVFGRLGDMIGRKYTFLVTILIMGLSTFIVGLLPSYATIGAAAPIILIALRLLQGLALGVRLDRKGAEGQRQTATEYVRLHETSYWVFSELRVPTPLALMPESITNTSSGPLELGTVTLLTLSSWAALRLRLRARASPSMKPFAAA